MLYALEKGGKKILFDRSNYVLTSADYGSIGASHATAKGTGQIGDRVSSSTLDTRPVEIIGFIKAKSAEEMERKKAALYQMCDPRESFTVYPSPERALECRADETVKFTASRLTNNARVAQFVIDATSHDPLFRDAVEKARKIVEWEPNFIWPLEIYHGFTFADRTAGLIATLENGGDVATGLMIRFTAAATIPNPVLTNPDTGEFIRLNRTMEAGEVVVVNTNYGQESVYSYQGDAVEDVINDLDLSSRKIDRVGAGGRNPPCPPRITQERLNVKHMDKIIYILCGVSAILSTCSIIITIRGRRKNGDGKSKEENKDLNGGQGKV